MPRSKESSTEALTERQMAAIRKQLLEQRQQILDAYERDVRAGQLSSDEGAEDIVDRANNAYTREFLFLLSDTQRTLLREIEEAVERLDSDEFGTCSHCGERITLARLLAVPWARYCIGCQELDEKGLLEP